jgi:hypothetical protein
MASPKTKATARTGRKFKDLESKKNPKGGGMTIGLLAPTGTTQGQVTASEPTKGPKTIITSSSLESAMLKNLNSII